MIITNSRTAALDRCARYTLNVFHRNLEGPLGIPLVDGGAVHTAIAHGLATRRWDQGLELARDRFTEEVKLTDILPEERHLIDDHWDMIEAIVDTYRTQYQDEGYEIVQPECSFDVPLPDSEHNCIWLHWVDLDTGEEMWGTPPPDKILAKQVGTCHFPASSPSDYDRSCPCWGPHRLVGQTDAIVLWHRFLWLLEHKTTAVWGDPFWLQWEIDQQPTIYLLGIWRATGMLPRGVVVNGFRKPTEAQVASWNARRRDGTAKATDHLLYERRPFLRTEEDLLRQEQLLVEACNEWEWRILNGLFRPRLQRQACTSYNRRCEFWTACVNHEEPGSLAGLRPRRTRYDDDKIQQQLITIKETTR